MPLTFDWSDTDLSLDSEEDKTLANAAIYATMGVGINRLTEELVKEFFTRVSFWEKVNGAYRTSVEGDVFFTIQECYRLVGLRTNASTHTRAQFYKKAYEAHERWNVPFRFPEKESSEALDGAAVV